jgi:hypothetical protein
LALTTHLVGAAYSLVQAINLSEGGYSDEHDLPEFHTLIRDAALSVADELPSIDPRWEAGYFFNSAILRIAAVNDRLGKYLGDRRDLTPAVRQEVNRLKHDVPGILHGRHVDLPGAIRALDALIRALLAVP